MGHRLSPDHSLCLTVHVGQRSTVELQADLAGFDDNLARGPANLAARPRSGVLAGQLLLLRYREAVPRLPHATAHAVRQTPHGRAWPAQPSMAARAAAARGPLTAAEAAWPNAASRGTPLLTSPFTASAAAAMSTAPARVPLRQTAQSIARSPNPASGIVPPPTRPAAARARAASRKYNGPQAWANGYGRQPPPSNSRMLTR